MTTLKPSRQGIRERAVCLFRGHVRRSTYGFGYDNMFRCARCGRGFTLDQKHVDLRLNAR